MSTCQSSGTKHVSGHIRELISPALHNVHKIYCWDGLRLEWAKISGKRVERECALSASFDFLSLAASVWHVFSARLANIAEKSAEQISLAVLLWAHPATIRSAGRFRWVWWSSSLLYEVLRCIVPAVVAGLPWCFITIIAEISCACKFCAPAFVIFRTISVFDSGVFVNCMCMHALFLYAAKWCAFKKNIRNIRNQIAYEKYSSYTSWAILKFCLFFFFCFLPRGGGGGEVFSVWTFLQSSQSW